MKLLSTKEAADQLNISKRSIQRWVRDGRLKNRSGPGKPYAFSITDLAALRAAEGLDGEFVLSLQLQNHTRRLRVPLFDGIERWLPRRSQIRAAREALQKLNLDADSFSELVSQLEVLADRCAATDEP